MPGQPRPGRYSPPQVSPGSMVVVARETKRFMHHFDK
jgi:hypothetical protein